MMSAQRYAALVAVLMICLTVIYLNFQHTSGCTTSGDEDVKMYIESLNKRLLKAESEVCFLVCTECSMYCHIELFVSMLYSVV